MVRNQEPRLGDGRAIAKERPCDRFSGMGGSGRARGSEGVELTQLREPASVPQDKRERFRQKKGPGLAGQNRVWLFFFWKELSHKSDSLSTYIKKIL